MGMIKRPWKLLPAAVKMETDVTVLQKLLVTVGKLNRITLGK